VKLEAKQITAITAATAVSAIALDGETKMPTDMYMMYTQKKPCVLRKHKGYAWSLYKKIVMIDCKNKLRMIL
jgi:hypothetical protein